MSWELCDNQFFFPSGPPKIEHHPTAEGAQAVYNKSGGGGGSRHHEEKNEVK